MIGNSRKVTLLALVLAIVSISHSSAAPLPEISVTDLQLIGTTRVGRSVFEYEYSVTVSNAGPSVNDVVGTLSSGDQAVEVVDGTASFGQIGVQETATGDDSVVIRFDRRATNLDRSLFTWTFDGEIEPTVTLSALPRAVPVSGDAPLLVTFSPDATTNNAIELYQWDFDGDGRIDASDTVGRNFTFTYQSGTHLPSLTVTDANGDTATATVTISAGNEPPRVTAEASPSNGGVPLNVRFTAVAVDSEGIQDYGWDFDGDGTIDSTSTTPNEQFTYQTEGVFRPILTVRDTLGATTAIQVPSVEVRAGPSGSPTVVASASPSRGSATLGVTLSGAASNLGSAVVSLWEWDIDGDGIYESSSATSSEINHDYDAPGSFFTRVRITTDTGLQAEDVVEVQVIPSLSLSISQDTINTDLGEVTTIDTTLGGTTNISVIIEDSGGSLVRTLVRTTEREAGIFNDPWDGLNDTGQVVPEGQYRAILLYEFDGTMQRLDLGLTTGGRQYNPRRTRIPSSFQPYANNPLVIDYTLTKPAEVTAFMGRFYANTRLVTFFQRDAQGKGTHRITWHGENSDGQLIHPPAGDRFLFGIWAYDLPDNAIFVQNRIDVSQLNASPPIFTPTGRDTVSDVKFVMSKAGSVEIAINDTVSGLNCRTEIVSGLDEGNNAWQWDGRDDAGNFVSPGSYRIAITGSDASGGKSITQYTLQRVYY